MEPRCVNSPSSCERRIGRERAAVTRLAVLTERFALSFDDARLVMDRVMGGAVRPPPEASIREIAAEAGVSPRVVLRAILEELLPLDEQRRSSLRVLTAYYTWSLTGPAMAAVFLHDEQPLEKLVAALITAAGPRPGIDPAPEADLLVGGVTGLGLDLLHGRRTPADVRRILDHHLTRILRP